VPQATFWFSSPFREWIGRRSLTLAWAGRITLREVWERLAADHPRLRANLPREGIQEEAMSHLTAVIVEGDILTLDAEIKDGAKVDVLTPLSGGNRTTDSDRDIRQRQGHEVATAGSDRDRFDIAVGDRCRRSG
jgi:molybdopterin converting factor small subunit